MPDKIKSEIVRIDLADASYKDTHAYIEPTYVNFFFGNNGAGKSTIAKASSVDMKEQPFVMLFSCKEKQKVVSKTLMAMMMKRSSS